MGLQVDLNCDLGESYGDYVIGQDHKVLDYVTSANVACGYHAGDHNVMAKTVRLAKKAGTAVGAHPGFPDLGGFGRRKMEISADEIYRLIIYQIGALQAFCRVEGVRVQHVKPHGALYQTALHDRSVAEAIAEAVYAIDSSLVLFGLSGSELIAAGQKRGLRTASEVFADRTYQPDGTLTPRHDPDAFIRTPAKAAERIMEMIEQQQTTAVDGTFLSMRADTICVHGDNPEALAFVKELRKMMTAKQITIAAVGDKK
ncbi:LamB/YcsF family protein [Bacillus piscicola]|uniref:LamB/YcsF family protein n=1 Tax=Bacillus piscicola TaxID=1632684 RepID=UPI001F08B8D1|nr:5-oxoprolinase subunit PxpA [Bacillus piscicola]